VRALVHILRLVRILKFYCDLPAKPAQKNIAASGMLKDKAGQ